MRIQQSFNGQIFDVRQKWHFYSELMKNTFLILFFEYFKSIFQTQCASDEFHYHSHTNGCHGVVFYLLSLQ